MRSLWGLKSSFFCNTTYNGYINGLLGPCVLTINSRHPRIAHCCLYIYSGIGRIATQMLNPLSWKRLLSPLSMSSIFFVPPRLRFLNKKQQRWLHMTWLMAGLLSEPQVWEPRYSMFNRAGKPEVLTVDL